MTLTAMIIRTTTLSRATFGTPLTLWRLKQRVYLAVLGDVVSDLEVPVSSATLGVDYPFRNPLPVKMSHLVLGPML